MQLFLSYASEDRQIAEQIQLALLGARHHVFYDRESLPPGGDYHARIERAVQESDVFLFLISPDSVVQGSFALTELKYARIKWPHPKDKVLPVIVRPTAWDTIPNYLKAVTALEPEGSVAAEVVTAVAALERRPSRRRMYVIVALMALLALLGVALIANWNKIFLSAQRPEPTIPSSTPHPSPAPCPSPTRQTPETLTAPHAPKIEINQQYTMWEEQIMQFGLEPGESKVIKGGDLYARVATYPESSCVGPGFVPYTWQVRIPYPGGGDLEIRKVLMGGKTERVGLGSMGNGEMSVCDEHTFKNNGVARILVELRYASAADLSQ